MPNTKNIFIVRHGETEFNRKGMVQGSGIDAPLNEMGRNQAVAFYNTYKEYPFEKIYVSNLLRTQQSIQRFIDDNIPYEKLAGLNEISWGSQEGKPFSPESAQLYEKTVEQWNNGDLDVNIAGGESPNQVRERQKVAIDHILSMNGEKEVLICMHGRAMRILLSWLLGHSLKLMDNFAHANLGLYQLVYSGSRFRITRFNDTSHLNGLGPV